MIPIRLQPHAFRPNSGHSIAAKRWHWPMPRRIALTLLLTLLIGAGSGTLCAQDTNPRPGLMDMSLENLMVVKVTSVSKKEQKLSETPAAIYVITQEEIRGSGVTNVPDLLRMVPGLE